MSTILSSTMVQEFHKLSLLERLDVVEALVRQMREEWQLEIIQRRQSSQQQLAAAAAALRKDYESDVDLTAFTSLDGEAFYE